MASQTGIGVLIARLFGLDDGGELAAAAVGKIIREATVSDKDVVLRFTDGSGICFVDKGQSCCEARYMTTDDRPEEFVGATFLDASIKDGPEEVHEWECHEVQFLEIQTSKGFFTVKSHNVHNGYYGGFCITVEAVASRD